MAVRPTGTVSTTSSGKKVIPSAVIDPVQYMKGIQSRLEVPEPDHAGELNRIAADLEGRLSYDTSQSTESVALASKSFGHLQAAKDAMVLHGKSVREKNWGDALFHYKNAAAHISSAINTLPDKKITSDSWAPNSTPWIPSAETLESKSNVGGQLDDILHATSLNNAHRDIGFIVNHYAHHINKIRQGVGSPTPVSYSSDTPEMPLGEHRIKEAIDNTLASQSLLRDQDTVARREQAAAAETAAPVTEEAPSVKESEPSENEELLDPDENYDKKSAKASKKKAAKPTNISGISYTIPLTDFSSETGERRARSREFGLGNTEGR